MGLSLILSAVQPRIIWGSSSSNFCFLTSPNMDSDEILGQDLLKPEKEDDLDEK